MFLYAKTHRYLKNDYRFFDTLKSEDRKIRGNCNLLIKVKFHEFFFTVISKLLMVRALCKFTNQSWIYRDIRDNHLWQIIVLQFKIFNVK